MINVILMHGKDTNPEKKWYPWLKEEMEKRSIVFQAPYLPKEENPVLSEWVAILSSCHPDEDSILIGHSRGGVAILRWLETQSSSIKIKKVILIATNAGEIKKSSKNGFFLEHGYDYQKIKTHCSDFVVLHSKDDPWVPFEDGVSIARGLGAKFLEFEDRGHFGSKLKKQEIPELLDEICNKPI